MINLISYIESSINCCTGDRDMLMKRLLLIETEEDAFKLLEEVNKYKPIMGLEQLPTNVGDAMEATRLRVEREDFKERHDNKR